MTGTERAQALAEKHGATSYRNRADTSNPAFGFTLQQLQALIAEVEQAAHRTTTPQPAAQELDALEPQVPDDFLAREPKPFGQHHAGRNHKGDRVWHTNSEGTFWCGDWRNRTPAELERECLSTVKDLRVLAAQTKQGEQG